MSREARKAALTQEEAGLSSDAAALQKQLEVKLGAPCSHTKALCLWMVTPHMQSPPIYKDKSEPLQELLRQITEVKEHMERIASRRKHVAEALSGRSPDQSKTAEQVQDDVKAAADLKVGSVPSPGFRIPVIFHLIQSLTTESDICFQAVLDEVASKGTPATAPEQATQPIAAYADALATLLTCTQASASEVGIRL